MGYGDSCLASLYKTKVGGGRPPSAPGGGTSPAGGEVFLCAHAGVGWGEEGRTKKVLETFWGAVTSKEGMGNRKETLITCHWFVILIGSRCARIEPC